MTAGGSAGLETERQLALASAHEAEALLGRERAESFRAASVSEKRTDDESRKRVKLGDITRTAVRVKEGAPWHH
jgi:hypothetical protein